MQVTTANMVQTSFNELYRKQNQKLIRATFKKGLIVSVNLAASTADVSIVGNPSTILKNVPFASHIIASLVIPNDKCRLDLFDETNPNDMVIAYIYGRPMPYAST